MITEYKSALYRISYQGVSMIENALGNPNLIQISVVLGCSIIVSPQQGGGIQYLPNGESRKWFLYGVNTKLNKTGHHFIYARLNRDGDQAYLIFSVNDYAIDGTINGENPSPAYYYVKVGEITETDALEGATKQRKITFDYGKYQTDETREGNFWQLRADSQGNEYIITKYPVLSQGAFTQYATLDPVVPSIFEGIPYDNQTIWFNPATQRVEVIGGTGGGEAGSVKWVNITGKPTWIGDTKPTYNWSEIQGEKPFYTKEEIASKFVTIDTEQEITALKHFTAGLSVGESKKKIYEENGVVYIDADVAVTGAMTFYASAGRSVSTIMDAVAVDGITIKKENNVLKAIAGAGSSFDENAMWSALSGSSDNQINKSHLTTALDGYATQNWVIENYATKSELSDVSNKLSDFLEGSDTDNIINKWKELEAFLSGMAGTDNLAEILETKADKKYVDSTFVTLATKQTITGEKTFSSVLNTAAIKASGAITAPSLAVSDWVTIAGIKLRKLEDGALMLEGNLALTGALTMYASNGQSFDTIYDGLPIDNDTIYWQEVDGSRVLKAKEGSGSSFDKSAMWTALAGSTTEQINKSHLTTALTGYATESWVSGKNYAVKATTLAGYGITDGINAVSVTGTGNAVTAASISGHTLTLTKGSTFSLSGHKHAWSDITSGKPTTLSGYGITDAYTKTESDSKYPTKTGSGASGTWGINVTGNAGSATKLQTPRSLWGRSFDGTGNVSGNLDNVGNITGSGTIDVITKNNQNIRFKINNDDTLSVLLELKSFRPFGAASNSINLGLSDAKWKDLYLGGNANIDGVTKTGDFYIGGIRLHKTADGVITLEGNLAVTGGVTMYAIDPVSASTIMDGVVVDGTTIKKENGKLVAVGGGEAGSVAWGNISGKPSVFATNIANITDLHSSWDAVLKAQKPNWLTAVSIATISDLHANWDALLKAAPSAYVTRWPTISEVTGKQNLVVKLNGGTTEGTNQFTYNATGAKTINITPAGIGAAASSHNHSWSNITSGKPTTLAGYGITDGVNSVSVTGGGNAITSASISGHSLTLTKGSTFLLSSQYTAADILAKLKTVDGAGSDLEADILALTGETGSMTGTNTPAHVGMQVFQYYQSGNGPTDYGNFLRIRGNGGGCGELFLGWDPSNNTSNIWYKSKRDTGSWGSWRKVAFTDMNVASATKLETTRTIWGQNFNGQQNVSGTLTDVAELYANGKIQAPRYVWTYSPTTRPSSTNYFNDSNACFEYSTNYSVVGLNTVQPVLRWGNAISGYGFQTKYLIGSARTEGSWGRIFIAVSNNDYSSSTGCSLSICGDGYIEVSGNILATGGSSFYGSDIRYKSIIHPVMLLALNKIAEAPSFVYRWNKQGMNQKRLNLGGSAQYTQSVLPWAVEEKDNFLSMDYATVAYTFAVHTARHLMNYETRTDKKIKKLENRVKYLEKQLKKLGYEEVRTLDDQSV